MSDTNKKGLIPGNTISPDGVHMDEDCENDISPYVTTARRVGQLTVSEEAVIQDEKEHLIICRYPLIESGKF